MTQRTDPKGGGRTLTGRRFEARTRQRLLWSLVASACLNLALWVTYPLAVNHQSEQKRHVVVSKVNVAMLHIDRRRAPKRRARRPPPGRPQTAFVHTPVPVRPAKRKPVVPKKIAVAPRPAVHRSLRRPRVRRKPSSLASPPTPMPYHGASGSLTFTPHHSGRFRLPPNWATQDLANGAAADTSLWLDFKHAKGAFVPRVFILHLKATYLSGPSLRDAVHDITESLTPDGIAVSDSKAQRVCNATRDGWYLAYERPDDDLPGQYENIIFVDGDTVYRVIYSRPDGQGEDPATRAALDTVCPSS